MERDIRRDRGQWRGCHSFKDIICDGEGGYSPSRDGGLKMGETYFYYVSAPASYMEVFADRTLSVRVGRLDRDA